MTQKQISKMDRLLMWMERAEKAEAELAALREDKARLDWLEEYVNNGLENGKITKFSAGGDAALRGAIDAARKERP